MRGLVSGLLLLLVAACGDSSIISLASTSATAEKENAEKDKAPVLKVALIMKTLTNPFFIAVEKGARQAQRETGIDLRVMTATQETSVDQQVAIVESQIAARVNAIVIAPGDSRRLIPVLKRAQDAGIAVVNIDNRLSPQEMEASNMKPVPFISVDNAQAAYLSAKYIAGKTRRPAEAAIFEGIRAADNARERRRGAERAFSENPRVRVVASETANWKIDEAYEVAKQVFEKHPRISLVFCANDMMAIGVIRYLQESGNTKVQVAGFDALEEAKMAIRAGQMAATVDHQAGTQGYQGIMTALKIVRGEKVPDELQVDAWLVTAELFK